MGEKNQSNWWDSSFFTKASEGFLVHTFPRTVLLGQYHGVNEAARIIHDEYIGVGTSYHLYRLPESIEREIAKSIQELSNENFFSTILDDSESAMKALNMLTSYKNLFSEGPLKLGVYTDKSLFDLISRSLSYYSSAFSKDVKSFPYISDE